MSSSRRRISRGIAKISEPRRAGVEGDIDNSHQNKPVKNNKKKVHWPDDPMDLVDCRLFDTDEENNNSEEQGEWDNEEHAKDNEEEEHEPGPSNQERQHQLSIDQIRQIDSQQERKRMKGFLRREQGSGQSINGNIDDEEEDDNWPQRLEWRPLIPVDIDDDDWPEGLPIVPGRKSEAKLEEERRWAQTKPNRRSELLETGNENDGFDEDHEVPIIPIENKMVEEENENENEEEGEEEQEDEEELGNNDHHLEEEEDGRSEMDEDELEDKENRENAPANWDEQMGDEDEEEEENGRSEEEYEPIDEATLRGGENTLGSGSRMENSFQMELDPNPSCSSAPPKMPSSEQIKKEVAKINEKYSKLKKELCMMLKISYEDGKKLEFSKEKIEEILARFSDDDEEMDEKKESKEGKNGNEEKEENEEEKDEGQIEAAENDAIDPNKIVDDVGQGGNGLDGEDEEKEQKEDDELEEKEGQEELSEHTVGVGNENCADENVQQKENEQQNCWASCFEDIVEEEEEGRMDENNPSEVIAQKLKMNCPKTQNSIEQIGGLRRKEERKELPRIKIDPDEEELARKSDGIGGELAANEEGPTKIQQKRKKAAENFIKMQNNGGHREHQSSSNSFQTNCSNDQIEGNDDENGEGANRREKKKKKEKSKDKEKGERKRHRSRRLREESRQTSQDTYSPSSSPPATRSRHEHLQEFSTSPILNLINDGPTRNSSLILIENVEANSADIPNFNCVFYFGRGNCEKGSKCNFLHGDVPTRGSEKSLKGKNNSGIIRNELTAFSPPPIRRPPASPICPQPPAPPIMNRPPPPPPRGLARQSLEPEMGSQREPSIMSASSHSTSSKRDHHRRSNRSRSRQSRRRSRSRSKSNSLPRAYRSRSRSRPSNREPENRNRSRSRTRIIIEISDEDVICINENDTRSGRHEMETSSRRKYGQELPSQRSEFRRRSRSRSVSRSHRQPSPRASSPPNASSVSSFRMDHSPPPPPRLPSPFRLQLPSWHRSFTKSELNPLIADCPHFVHKGWCGFGDDCCFSHGDGMPTSGYRTAERKYAEKQLERIMGERRSPPNRRPRSTSPPRNGGELANGGISTVPRRARSRPMYCDRN